MKPRVLRLLSAGGAPAGWLRQAGRAAARLGAVDRAVAWTGELARLSPSLRDAPLWGDTLGALASSVPARPPADDGGGALPGGFPRRASSPDASPSTRTDDAPRSRPGRRVPPPSRQRSSMVGRAAASSTIGSPSRSAPRSAAASASLPRHAGEGVLHRWSPETGGARSGGPLRRSGTSWASSGPAWDQAAGRAPFISAVVDGERRVWTPSPQSLPILSVRDRLHGWAADRAKSQPDSESAFARGEGDARWIARVASAAARRLPFRIARTEDRGGVDSTSAALPSLPARDLRGAALADEWAWPLDGPTVAAEVLARLAARVRATPRPPAPPGGGRGAPVDAPSAVRPPSNATRQGGDDASPAARRPPRLAAWSGEGASAAPSPSPHPLFRPRRAAAAVEAADAAAGRSVSPFPPSIHPSSAARRLAEADAVRDRSVSRFPSAFRSPGATSANASGVAWTNGEGGAAGDADGAADGETAARDRWGAWPAVLAWPRREARSGAAGAASGVARRSGDGDAGTIPEPPRLARSVAGDAPLPLAPASDAARGVSRRSEAAAVPARNASAEDDGARDGWLIDTLRARSPQPGLSVEPGGATIPIHHHVPAVETAELRGGIPGVLAGAPPLPWMTVAGAAHEADALGELDDLAGRVRRILEDEVRRHGIDV